MVNVDKKNYLMAIRNWNVVMVIKKQSNIINIFFMAIKQYVSW